MRLLLIASIALLALPPAAPTRPAVISAEAAIAAVRAIEPAAALPATNRVSQMGPDGNIDYDARRPAIAYNPADNQYLVVWSGDTTGGVVNDEFEIWGQRIDAASGLPIGVNFRVSRMGPDGNTNYAAFDPAIAYNAADNQYLVVWSGDTHTGGLASQEFEIWGQRLSNTGIELSVNFRVSQMGPDGNADYDAYNPAITHNPVDNQYLVVWEGDTNAGGLADFEYEIWGQRLSTTGGELDGDFRISRMGPDGSSGYIAADPALAYNTANNQFLVIWTGDTDDPGINSNEFEIWGQRLSNSGAELGDHLRISQVGPDGTSLDGAISPAIVYNATDRQYLVAWEEVNRLGSGSFATSQISGQRLSNTGAAIGDDFRISQMGPQVTIDYDAFLPALAWNATDNQYLVVWWGDTNADGLAVREYEIWGQRLSNVGVELGGDFRVSQMGLDGNAEHNAFAAAIAYNTADNHFLAVWYGDTNTGGLVDDEFEIWSQRVADVQISRQGLDGIASIDASFSAAAYNAINNEYLVVWQGHTTAIASELEIWGRRIDAASGAPVGVTFRISTTGADSDVLAEARDPSVAWNAADNQYLVVWYGDRHNSLADEEYEIWGQLLNATGGELGGDFRVSQMGPDGNAAYDAVNPIAAYNATSNQYLVVWQGNTIAPGLAAAEAEIWGKVLSNTAANLSFDFRISNMGPDGNAAYGAASPGLAWNATENEYLVVWWGDTNAGGLLNDENEIWGQRLSASGAELGADFRISAAGPDGAANFDAFQPEAAWNATDNEYLVVWWATTAIGGSGDDEHEVWGGRISASGAPRGGDFRISQMGPDGDSRYDALTPAIAWLPAPNQYLVVWYGDSDAGGLVDEESEIWGQRLSPAGDALGAQLRVSASGPSDGSMTYGAANVGVVASTDGTAVVVWQSDSALGGLVDDELEIWGRVLRQQQQGTRAFLPLVQR